MESKRGGKREGAGRKRKEPTIVIRVPVSLQDEVKALIAKHNSKEELGSANTNVKNIDSKTNTKSANISTAKQGNDSRLEIEVNGKRYPVKYRKQNEYGGFDNWHGKGKKPKWLIDHLNSGGLLSDVLVKKDDV